MGSEILADSTLRWNFYSLNVCLLRNLINVRKFDMINGFDITLSSIVTTTHIQQQDLRYNSSGTS